MQQIISEGDTQETSVDKKVLKLVCEDILINRKNPLLAGIDNRKLTASWLFSESSQQLIMCELDKRIILFFWRNQTFLAH